jgi:hypothetical protein
MSIGPLILVEKGIFEYEFVEKFSTNARRK